MFFNGLRTPFELCVPHEKERKAKRKTLTAPVFLLQATVALEMLDEVPELDAILAAVSGAGLAAGCCLYIKASRSPCKGSLLSVS